MSVLTLDRANIRARHEKMHQELDGYGDLRPCGEWWPCESVALLDALERAEQALCSLRTP